MSRNRRLIVLIIPFATTLVPISVDAYHTPGHTNYHDISMLPPVGFFGGYAHLHCEFHGSCGQASGTGNDWDYWTDGDYRGVVWRASLECGRRTST